MLKRLFKVLIKRILSRQKQSYITRDIKIKSAVTSGFKKVRLANRTSKGVHKIFSKSTKLVAAD